MITPTDFYTRAWPPISLDKMYNIADYKGASNKGWCVLVQHRTAFAGYMWRRGWRTERFVILISPYEEGWSESPNQSYFDSGEFLPVHGRGALYDISDLKLSVLIHFLEDIKFVVEKVVSKASEW